MAARRAGARLSDSSSTMWSSSRGQKSCSRLRLYSRTSTIRDSANSLRHMHSDSRRLAAQLLFHTQRQSQSQHWQMISYGMLFVCQKVYLDWLGSWKAVGRALLDTDLRPVRMQTTASVPICSVLWNSWFAATDRIARSLGMPPMELADPASCIHMPVILTSHPRDLAALR